MLYRQRQWLDLVHLAVQTDSTRVIGLWLYSHTENLNLEGVGVTHLGIEQRSFGASTGVISGI